MLQVLGLALSHRAVPLLEDISFELEAGQLLCLLGTSGSGKTTLLRALAGLHPVDTGQIRLDGQVMNTLPCSARGVGMVFQDYALFPHLTVQQNVAYGYAAQSGRRVEEWLELVGLTPYAHRRPAELSGGQQQRLALIRALAAAPKLLLLDEPFSSLDAALRLELRDEVRAIIKSSGIPAILVTHDAEEAMVLADKILLLHAGRTAQLGTAEDLYYRPQSAEVVRYFSAAHELKAQVENHLVSTPFGALPADFSAALAHVLIRPEAFQLTTAANALSGTVLANRFLGTRRVLTVKTPHYPEPLQMITAPETTAFAGSDIHFSLDLRHVFAFPAA